MPDETLSKVHRDIEAFKGDDALYWYTGCYLVLPRVFMNIVRTKLIYSPLIESIVIPSYTVQDPVSNRKIQLNIMDRYFFIGVNTPVVSEEDLGLQHGSVILMRDPTKKIHQIEMKHIKRIINNHLHKHRDVVQQHVTVMITGGTFKDWHGIVTSTPDDTEHVTVNFTADDYEFDTHIPIALCKPVSY